MRYRLAVHIVLLLVVCSASRAQDLIPDPSFGINGHVTTSFKTLDSRITSILIQPDNKILACGSSFSGSSNRLALARFNADGTVDKSFGKDGKILVPVGSYMEYESNDIQLLPDGSIIVAVTNGKLSDQHIILLKFDIHGNAVEDFGANGIVTAVFDQKSVVTSLAVQDDGKIVIGGKIYEDFSLDYTDFLIARFLPDGSADRSFGIDGRVTVNFGTATNKHVVSEDAVNSIKIQPDGKILAAGFTFAEPSNSTSDFAMIRLHFDGSIDDGFGKNGRVITNFGRGETAHSLKLLNDGKILLSGIYYYNDDSAQKACIAKYNEDGRLDTEFGDGGKVITEFAGDFSSGFVFSSIWQSKGKLLISGYINNNDADLMLICYNADGTIDKSFGENGHIVVDLGGNETAYASASAQDGSVILGGSFQDKSHRSFLVTKFKPIVAPVFAVGDTSFSFGPNPFSKYIDIELNHKTKDPIVIEIMNITGDKITTLVPSNPCGDGCISERIVMPDTLSEGTYLLNISSGDAAATVEIHKKQN